MHTRHDFFHRPTLMTILGYELQADTASQLYYVDVWSSRFTWGGLAENKPVEGDFVVIKEGQTILLDENTPILKMLLIQGMLHLCFFFNVCDAFSIKLCENECESETFL